jgi:hypothetical protein
MNYEVTDDRTMPDAQAKRYMKELRARKVPYAFQTLSNGLVTVSTSSAFATASYDAFMRASRGDSRSGNGKTREST